MILINLLQKVCSKCEQPKSVELFSYQSRGLYNRMCWCKKCQAKYQSEYRPEWYKENRSKVQLDKYAVLCYNCNLSRGFYGYCHDSSALPQLYACNSAVDHQHQ